MMPSVEGHALVSLQPQAMAPRPSSRASVNTEIERLLAEKKRITQEKKEMQNNLKNAQRRRKRLKHKVRLLSQRDF